MEKMPAFFFVIPDALVSRATFAFHSESKLRGSR